MKTITNGFTLVELMVVVVIIALLASIAVPKFTALTSKAKASEIPSVMAQIGQAEFMYFQETNTFVSVALNNWQHELKTKLGVEIYEGLFSYYVTNANDVGFLAHAKVEETFGAIPNTTVEVTMDQVDQINFVNDDGTFRSYLRAWVD